MRVLLVLSIFMVASELVNAQPKLEYIRRDMTEKGYNRKIREYHREKVKEEPDIMVGVEPDNKGKGEPDIMVGVEPDIMVEVEPDNKGKGEPDIIVEVEPDIMVEVEPDNKGKGEPDIIVEVKPDNKGKGEPNKSTESLYYTAYNDDDYDKYLAERARKGIEYLFNKVATDRTKFEGNKQSLEILLAHLSQQCPKITMWSTLLECMLSKENVPLNLADSSAVFEALRDIIWLELRLKGVVRLDEVSGATVTSRQIAADYLEEYLLKPCKLITSGKGLETLNVTVMILSDTDLRGDAPFNTNYSAPYDAIYWTNQFLGCKRLLISDKDKLIEYILTETEKDLMKEVKLS